MPSGEWAEDDLRLVVNTAIRRSYHERWCGPECPNGPRCDEGAMDADALGATTETVVEYVMAGPPTRETGGDATSACPFCDHARHDGEFCLGWTDEDCPEPCCPHPCACSYPDPYNYVEVPANGSSGESDT